MDEVTINAEDDERLLFKQVELLYKQGPASIFGTAVTWIAVLYVFYGKVPDLYLLLWALPILLTNLNKIVLLYRFKRSGRKEFDPARWFWRYKTGAILHGVLWGCIAFTFPMVEDEALHLFVFYVVGGMAMGAIATTAATFGTFVWFALPLLVPTILMQFLYGSEMTYILGALMIFFTISVLLLSYNYNKTIRNTLRLQILNSDLVSRLTEAKETAQAASEAKSQFLAHVSHDIRTPMNSVIGFGQLLAKTKLDPAQKDYLSAINISSNSLLNIINDILDLSSIESGALRLEHKPFKLRAVLEETMTFLLGLAYQKGLDFTLHIDNNCPDGLVGDPERLKQVLVNLLNNAIKFTPQGQIQLAANLESQAAGRAVLTFSVEDTGVGVDPRDQERMFEPFTQLENFEKRRFQGTGLGLTISRRIVEQLGGELALESQVAVGSRFYFSIPFYVDLPASRGRGSQLTGRRVYIVEPHQPTREMWVSHLESLGAAVFDRSLDDLPQSSAEDLVVVGTDSTDRETLLRLKEKLSAMEGLSILLVRTLDPAVLGDLRRSGKLLCFPKMVTRELVRRELVALLAGTSDDVEVDYGQMPQFAGKKVLVVDDNALGRKLLATLVGQHGAQVLEAADGESAVELCHRERPDLVFLDIQLPGISGTEAARSIRDFDSAMPIIATTAHALPAERQQFIDAGMNDVYLKPINPERLRMLLVQWLGDPAIYG